MKISKEELRELNNKGIVEVIAHCGSCEYYETIEVK